MEEIPIPIPIPNPNPNPIEELEQEEIPQITFFKRLSLFIVLYRKSFVLFLCPILLSPLVIIGSSPASWCLYLICIMVILWVTEALAVAITSLVPIIVFPLLDILSTKDCGAAFISDISITLLGTYIFGQALEYCMLDQRMALKILKFFGCQPSRLHTVLVITTFLASAWIINMYIVAIMCPIVRAILKELEVHGLCREFEEGHDENNPRPSKTALGFYMGVTFAAIFGGCSTFIGTGANEVMVVVYKELFFKEISFFAFMGYAFPVMLLLVTLSTVYVQWLYLGLFQRKDSAGRVDCVYTKEMLQQTEQSVREHDQNLTPMAFHEKLVIWLFVIMGVLLLTRSPGFYRGWNYWIFDNQVKEATISTLILVLLVAFPSHLSFMNYFKDDSDYLPLRRSRGAISWNYVRYKVPWRIIFMMGGGLTLAEGSRVTQMSYSLADYIYTFDRFPKFFLLFILCFPVFLLTQVFGNVPLAYIILPVIKDLAECHEIHPTYFMIPTALMCSLSLTTAVGASANTLVVGFANIRGADVFMTGFLPGIVSFLFVLVSFPVYGALFFPEVNGKFFMAGNKTICTLLRESDY